jgi:hypothetical protein
MCGMCNVRVRRIRVTNVAVGKQQVLAISVCVVPPEDGQVTPETCRACEPQ